jgi:hypothetical protein
MMSGPSQVVLFAQKIQRLLHVQAFPLRSTSRKMFIAYRWEYEQSDHDARVSEPTQGCYSGINSFAVVRVKQQGGSEQCSSS